MALPGISLPTRRDERARPGAWRRGSICLALAALLAVAGCAASSTAADALLVSAAQLPPVVVVDDGNGRTVPLRLDTLAPGGRLVSGFGWRGGRMGGRGAYHEGIDIAAPRNTPVHAAAPGTVVAIGRDRGYGKYIRIRHSDRVETLYAHLAKITSAAKVGRHVTPDDVIGRVGSTGRSSGPHLHFEVRRAGKPVDPLALGATRTAQASRAPRAD